MLRRQSTKVMTAELKQDLESKLDNSVDTEDSMVKSVIKKDKDYEYMTVRPSGTFKTRWDLLIMLLAMYNCFQVPLSISFDNEIIHSNFFLVLNSMVDFIFLVDIFICFRTIFIDEKETSVVIRKE